MRVAFAAVLAVALPLAVIAQTRPKVYKGSPQSSKSGTKRKGTIKRKGTAKSKAPATKSRRTAAKARPKSKTTPPRPRGQLRPTTERYKEIETALASRGYLGEEPSGKWGPPSVDALRAFQADHQLPPTGKLDSLSLIQLGLGPKQ